MYYTNKPQLKSTQCVHTKAACVTNSIFSNLHTKTPVLLTIAMYSTYSKKTEIDSLPVEVKLINGLKCVKYIHKPLYVVFVICILAPRLHIAILACFPVLGVSSVTMVIVLVTRTCMR